MLVGLDKITGDECTVRRSPRIEHKGTLSFRDWEEEDPTNKVREETEGRGIRETK